MSVFSFTGNSLASEITAVERYAHTSFKDSDYFDLSSPENGPWACQYYTPEEGYVNMKGLCTYANGHSDSASSGQGNAWIAETLDNEYWSYKATVGKYKLCHERAIGNLSEKPFRRS